MPAKILVIEDDQDILDVLEYVLANDGYEVISSTSGAILTNINQINPDLIVLDEWLNAHEKGSDLCRRLKTNANTLSIPVLMLSAVNSIELLVKQAGADGYIKKPFDIDELSHTIRQLILS